MRSRLIAHTPRRAQMSGVFAKLTRLAAEVSAMAARRSPLLAAVEELGGAQVGICDEGLGSGAGRNGRCAPWLGASPGPWVGVRRQRRAARASWRPTSQAESAWLRGYNADADRYKVLGLACRVHTLSMCLMWGREPGILPIPSLSGGSWPGHVPLRWALR